MKKKAVKKVLKKPVKKNARAKAPAKKRTNVLSFSDLFDLKKKKLAQKTESGWHGTDNNNVHTLQPNEGRKAKVQMSVRGGRTNGAGARHH